MTSNIDFLIGILIVLIILVYHYVGQHKLNEPGNNIFVFFLVLGMSDIFFDIVSTVSIEVGGPYYADLSKVLLTVFYLMQACVPYALYCYTQTLKRNYREVGRRNAQRMLFAPVLMMLLVLFNCFSELIFGFDDQGVYFTGPLYPAMYIYAVLFALLIAVEGLISYSQLGAKKYRVMLEFMLIMSLCVLIQYATRFLLLTGFGLGVGIIVLYFTLSNPRERLDGLTDIFNVQYFEEWAMHQIKGGRRFHVISIDFCRIKQINKILGTHTGDQILVDAGNYIWNLSESHYLFRLSGNRFGVAVRTLDEYERLRLALYDHYKSDVAVEGERIECPVIICGLIDAQEMGDSNNILNYIEYMASTVDGKGKSLMLQSDHKMVSGFYYNKEVEAYLTTAIREDLFDIYFQPIYSIKDGRFTAVEALSRLRHPTLGMISPEIFISVAEKNNLISQIGYLQFKKLCAFVREHRDIMDQIQNIKFNLSPAELMTTGYAKRLIALILENDLNPAWFQVEITESMATEYSDVIYRMTADLGKNGIRFCLDDFGSGFANLNTVLKMPFSVIKLDKSLLSGILNDPKIASFYKNIVDVFRSMSYTIVAEGVETKEEMDLVSSWGVSMIQGYYYSKPLDGEGLIEVLKDAQK